MKRIALPFIAMALSSPLAAQTAEPGLWHGYQVGLQLDYITDGALTFTGGEIELDGTQYNFFGGYRHQIDAFVMGAEYDFVSSRTDLVGFSGSTRQTTHRLGFELGYAVGRFLPYAGAGIAHIRFDGEGGTFTDTGSYAAVGLDYRVNINASVGVEITGHSFDALGGDALIVPTTPELTTIGVNYAISF